MYLDRNKGHLGGDVECLGDVGVNIVPKFSQTRRQLRKARHCASPPCPSLSLLCPLVTPRKRGTVCLGGGDRIQPPPSCRRRSVRLRRERWTHGSSAMESLRPNPSFAALSGMEARDKRAEEKKEDHGPSLHDVKRALKNNFRATGVTDDVTVRERARERERDCPSKVIVYTDSVVPR